MVCNEYIKNLQFKITLTYFYHFSIQVRIHFFMVIFNGILLKSFLTKLLLYLFFRSLFEQKILICTYLLITIPTIINGTKL